MPTLHIVRKVDIQFPLVDEEGRIIRGGHLMGKNVAADDGSVQKIAAAIIDDVDRSLSQHVHIPSGSHGSHVGEDGTKTTNATIAMDPNANGTRPEPNPHNHEQMPWKEKATATVAKSVPRIDETNPSQPEFSLPSSLTSSLRKYPSLFSKQSTVQTNTDRMVHITSIPPPTRPAKNIVTQDGIIGNAGANTCTSMALLPAAGTSNASSSARAKRASLGLLSDRSQPCDVSIELSKDNRASHLPPRKRLKYNYTDALELLMKDEKAVPQKKKDVGPSHTNLPQVPLTRPIPLGKSAGTPKRIAACTEEECDMAAALMSLPSRTPSSPSNSSSPKSTTITDGASLLSSIYNRPTDTDNNSGTAPISPISPTQPRLIFDIGAWFDQQQPGRRVQEQNRTHVELREPQSSHISSEDGSSKKRKIRPKNKDEDSVLFKCKVAGRPSDKSLANIDDTCIRMPKTSPFFELGKEKKHKRGKIQSHRGDKGFISHHPHPSSEVKKRIIKTPNSDPNSFFPSRLRTLLELAEDDGLADVFSWQPHGKAIKIHSKQHFVTDILQKYLGRMKHESFTRQLNLWNFQRISSGKDKGAYYHPDFVRDQPELMTKMKRVRIKGTGIRQKQDPSLDPDFYRRQAPFNTAVHRLVSSAADSRNMLSISGPRNRMSSSMAYTDADSAATADADSAATANILASFASGRA